ncbi:membrane protein [Altererythrobacter sp. B11]|uniref:DedA family protein n=1 Tax=Altererythrobacter sp. B11 TaxID=2060312 RepID=UPI000DC6E20A|nr:DedA family protein [Altererythrobacter sp. B11]BBC71811.1 membrane protein [Altererythrobacter sp. B11]
MQLEELLARYGLWALGLGAGFEGETVTVLGGLMVHRGLFPFLPAVLAASLGSFLADQTFFTIGRHFRNAAYVRKMSARPAFLRALAVFERHPVGFVFAFRFLYGLRTISPLAIGTTKLRASRFMAINAAAALLWGTCFVSLGYLFGQGIEAMFGRVRSVETLLAPLAAIAIGGYVVRNLMVQHRSRLKP